MANRKWEWWPFIGFVGYYTTIGCTLVAMGHFFNWPWTILIVPIAVIQIYLRRWLGLDEMYD